MNCGPNVGGRLARSLLRESFPKYKSQPLNFLVEFNKSEKGVPSHGKHRNILKNRIRHPKRLPKAPNGGIELLLIQPVEHLGKQGDVVGVKAGYAMNYLLPQGLATVATDHHKRMVDKHRAQLERSKRPAWPDSAAGRRLASKA